MLYTTHLGWKLACCCHVPVPCHACATYPSPARGAKGVAVISVYLPPSMVHTCRSSSQGCMFRSLGHALYATYPSPAMCCCCQVPVPCHAQFRIITMTVVSSLISISFCYSEHIDVKDLFPGRMEISCLIAKKIHVLSLF